MTHVDDSNLAPEAAGVSAMLQIVFGIGILEFWSNNGKVTMEDMFEDSTRVPGEFGFDPMGLGKGKSKEEMEKLQLSEIKNGRLVHAEAWSLDCAGRRQLSLFTDTFSFLSSFVGHVGSRRHGSPQLGDWRAAFLNST